MRDECQMTIKLKMSFLVRNTYLFSLKSNAGVLHQIFLLTVDMSCHHGEIQRPSETFGAASKIRKRSKKDLKRMWIEPFHTRNTCQCPSLAVQASLQKKVIAGAAEDMMHTVSSPPCLNKKKRSNSLRCFVSGSTVFDAQDAEGNLLLSPA